MSENKRGGARPGAGRPKAEEVRKRRTMRAHDDEWIIINAIADIYKHGDERAKKAVTALVVKYRAVDK